MVSLVSRCLIVGVRLRKLLVVVWCCWFCVCFVGSILSCMSS